jgi:hypothetical protein
MPTRRGNTAGLLSGSQPPDVPVFQGRGQLLTNLAEVSERNKDIRFSSRTRITPGDDTLKLHARFEVRDCRFGEGRRLGGRGLSLLQCAAEPVLEAN